MHAHRFRHTFATWAIAHDARELDVQHLLEHSSPDMVRRYSDTYGSAQAAARLIVLVDGVYTVPFGSAPARRRYNVLRLGGGTEDLVLPLRGALGDRQHLDDHPRQPHHLAVGVEAIVVPDRAAPGDGVQAVPEAVRVLVVAGLLEALGRDVHVVVRRSQVPRQRDVVVPLPEVGQHLLPLLVGGVQVGRDGLHAVRRRARDFEGGRAHGISQAALYAAVESGDLFEWRQADDCFVRYQVMEVQLDPTGTVPQKLLAVAWMTYAFAGCSGAIATGTAATLDWSALPDLGGTALSTPIRHGPFQIVPEDWTGATEEPEVHAPPAYNRDNPRYTTTLATARQLPYWRDPALPTGWTFGAANVDPEETVYGYMAAYVTPQGGLGLLIEGTTRDGKGLARTGSVAPQRE